MPSRNILATAGSLLLAVTVGGLVAVQSHLNGELALRLGGGMAGAAVTAVVSFGSGFLVLCLLCALVPRPRRGLVRVARAVRSGRLRPWHLVGGTAGALLVVSQGVTVATIGVALFTVSVVAGQTTSAMFVDKVGAGPAGRRPVTVGRTVGATVAVLAVGLAVSGRLEGAAALAPAALLLAALPLLAGAGAAWQQAVNGQVSVVGGPLAAAWTNFVFGTAVLVVFTVATLAAGGRVSPFPSTWWLYIGGSLGVVFITSAAVLVRVLGVLVFGLCAIAGQIVTALLLDLLVSDLPLGPLTVAGALLTLVGAGITARRTPRRPEAPPPTGPRPPQDRSARLH